MHLHLLRAIVEADLSTTVWLIRVILVTQSEKMHQALIHSVLVSRYIQCLLVGEFIFFNMTANL